MYKPTLNSSVLSKRDEKEVDFARKIFGNNALRLGLVLEIVEEDDEANISGLGPEYNVMSIEQDGSNGSNTVIYKNCINIDAFGGVADYFQFKHRASKEPKKAKKKGSLKEETGSIVLLLCLDGNSEKAVILKSVHNPKKNKVLTKDKGHHMEGEFNGVNWSIDKDGAMTVVFKSATEDDGTPTNEEAGGSNLKIEKDGSLEFADGNEEKIRIDKTAKTISITAEKDISATTKANVSISAGESVNITSKKDIIAAAEGKAAFNSKQAFDIKTDGKFSVVGADVNIKSDGAATLEASSNLVLKGTKVMIGPAPAPAVVLITKFLGVGFGGIPVVSSAIGPFSSSVLISS